MNRGTDGRCPSTESMSQWLENFRRHHGRALRVLHFGNIANNAYLNAKFLRAIGVDAQVMSTDYDHIMATPEWEEIEITRPYGDDNHPEFSLLDLKTYRRPEWFIRGNIQACAKQAGENATRALLLPAYIDPSPANTEPLAWQQNQIETVAEFLERASNKTQALIAELARRSDVQAEALTRNSEELVRQTEARLSAVLQGLAAQIDSLAGQLAGLNRPVNPWRRFRPATALWFNRIRELRLVFLNSVIDGARRIPALRRVYRALRYGEPLIRGHGKPGLNFGHANSIPLTVRAEASRSGASGSAIPGSLMACAVEKPRLAVQSMSRSVDENPEISRAIADFVSAFPNRPDQLTRGDLAAYVEAAPNYRKVFEHYDVVQCYGVAPIWGYLAGNRPYIGYEHGTLRVFTMSDDPLHRLTALSYRRVDHTFITNGDCLAYAQAIGVSNYSPMIHPVDVELHRRDLGEPRAVTKKRFEADVLLFCPLRHDWEIKGTDVHLRALPLIRASVPGRVVLLLTDWGLETAASRALLAELGCQDQVVWLPPLSRIPMARLMRAADVVLDQIVLPHFGATAPQALAAETPVISSYRPESTEWIVSEPAPILPAFSPEQVRDAVLTALDPEWRDAFRKRARHWVDTYHHPERLVKEHVRVYRQVLERSHGFGYRAVAPAI